MTQHTPGPWVWRSVWDDNNRGIALLLETMHRPVPCNDPVIFALREDWLGKLSPEREAAKVLLLAAPDMLTALVAAIEGAGFTVAGPSDHRAAEHGEPAWVCNARAVIANATTSGHGVFSNPATTD